MSEHKPNPEDYEYGGNLPSVESVEVESSARSSRLRATTVGTTALLVVAGLAGGAAFALSNPVKSLSNSAAPIVQSESNTVQAAETNSSPAATSNTDASAAPSASASATSHAVLGKTIAVPPAAFDDKNGEREFHENPPAATSTSGSGSGSTSSSAPANGSGQAATGSTTGTPTFGGGDDHHKKRPVNTADIRFQGGSDDNGNDN
jgi:hypothetical protein